MSLGDYALYPTFANLNQENPAPAKTDSDRLYFKNIRRNLVDIKLLYFHNTRVLKPLNDAQS